LYMTWFSCQLGQRKERYRRGEPSKAKSGFEKDLCHKFESARIIELR
jgi:hypothetical protein